MRRRAFLAAMGGAALVPLAGGAQQKRVPVVGYLALTSPGPFAPMLAAFHEGLAEIGFVEGRDVAFQYRWAEGRSDRLPALAADLVAHKVDLIATHGGVLAARAAKEATSTIPIVFETGTDPVAEGLVASMARPGGNLTGVSILTSELNPKRFELLSEMVPEAKVIAILVNPKNASADRVVSDVQKVAQPRGVRIEVVRATFEPEYDPAVAQARAKAGALLVANDPVFFSRHAQLVALAARHAIPAVYEWREFVEAGGLMSYGTSVAGMHREKGRYVGRVLAGANPADLPVSQPIKFELVINLKTAKALGLTVPQSLFARADEVIE
jgi:putative ABC transport system substrate-binding protein